MWKTLDNAMQYILLHHRWLFVVPFLLPASVLYECFCYVRNWIIFKLNTAPLLHDKRVREVQRQVREWREKHSDRQMCTARPGWQTMSFRQGRYKSTMYNVRLDMYDIIEVNEDKRYVRVEPLVNMGQLSRLLNPIGWTLAVVPELDDLTVGGMINGTGVESSSHKFGLFQHICLAFEVVLCDGSVVRCSREEYSELFYAIPWSHGTIGFVVSADIKIVPAKSLVELHYQPVRSLKEAVQVFSDASHDVGNDFVEGIMYTKETAVIMTGSMVDDDGTKTVNKIGRWYKPWFYKHVETKLSPDCTEFTEYIPLTDYYHRHTRALFWEVEEIVPFGHNPLFRLLLGWTMPPKVSLLKLTQNRSITKLYEEKHIIQDLLIPVKKLEEGIMAFHKAVEVYPVWLCPFKLPDDPGMVHSGDGTQSDKTEMYVDVGVYGVPKSDDFDAVRTHREIEKFVMASRGVQMLYADTYTTREEFRGMFDHRHYDRMRQKLGCEKAFPEVYDKVNKKARK